MVCARSLNSDMVTVVAFGHSTESHCIFLKVRLYIIPKIICRNSQPLLIISLVVKEIAHAVIGKKLEHASARTACFTCIISGKIGCRRMERIEVHYVFYRLRRICWCLREGVEQLMMQSIEMLLALLIQFLVYNLELLRHNLKCRYRFHIVSHIVVASLCLFAFLLLKCKKCRGVWDEEEIWVILRIHHSLGYLLQ